MFQLHYLLVGAQEDHQDLVAHLEVPQEEATPADLLYPSPQATLLEVPGLLRKVVYHQTIALAVCRRVACAVLAHGRKVVGLQGVRGILEDHPNHVGVEVLQKAPEGLP